MGNGNISFLRLHARLFWVVGKIKTAGLPLVCGGYNTSPCRKPLCTTTSMFLAMMCKPLCGSCPFRPKAMVLTLAAKAEGKAAF